jgi:hypothetical protein
MKVREDPLLKSGLHDGQLAAAAEQDDLINIAVVPGGNVTLDSAV